MTRRWTTRHSPAGTRISAASRSRYYRTDDNLASAVAFDPYATLPATRSFILIYRVGDATVRAGMIRCAERSASESRATNVTWHGTYGSKTIRAAQKEPTTKVIWFTGPSGAGRSTIANALEQVSMDTQFPARGGHPVSRR